jgi:hypothetical protein
MYFTYDGFTHTDGRRCFIFRSIDEYKPTDTFYIEVEMSLFAQNRVPMQEAPMFCLQLLKTACAEGPNCLEKFHRYRIFAEDLRPLIVERSAAAEKKALKALRRAPYRKPPVNSNLSLGARSKHH